MAETTTITQTETTVSTETPWNVIVHDDPVNLMRYVTYTLMKIFGYNETIANKLMMEVHESGSSVVWTGELERAEFYTQQLQSHQLKTTLEKAQ